MSNCDFNLCAKKKLTYHTAKNLVVPKMLGHLLQTATLFLKGKAVYNVYHNTPIKLY